MRPGFGIQKEKIMQCTCGNQTVNTVHKVSTQEKIAEWLQEEADVQELTINSDKCTSCGRFYAVMTDERDQIIKIRG